MNGLFLPRMAQTSRIDHFSFCLPILLALMIVASGIVFVIREGFRCVRLEGSGLALAPLRLCRLLAVGRSSFHHQFYQ